MTRDKLNNLIGEAYSKWDAPYRPLIQLLGEGIRQLMRIADQLEHWTTDGDESLSVYNHQADQKPANPGVLANTMMEVIKKIPLGRLYCNQCEEYDHECGCNPDIKERTRQKFFADHPKAAPAPDALVDVLKDVEAYLQGKKSGQTFEESDLVGRIKNALAARPKAAPKQSDALVEAVKEFFKDNVIGRDIIAVRKGAKKSLWDVTHNSIEKLYAAHEEHKNREEARGDANNMNLDPGEFPPTEVNDG